LLRPVGTAGNIAGWLGYKDLRPAPDLIREDLFQRFEPDQRRGIAAMPLDIFRFGHHSIYQFKDQP
jgi:hypothetical protein